MPLPLNHKTVILIDRGPYQKAPSGVSHDINRLIKTRSDTRLVLPLPLAQKSVWSCCVTSCLEYARMSWDIYCGQKLVSIYINDRFATRINSWDVKEQHFHYITAQLGEFPRASDGKDADPYKGIKAAVTALSKRTEAQKLQASRRGTVLNRGRIMYFTHLEDDSKKEMLRDAYIKALNEVYDASKIRDADVSSVDFCELLIVNVNRVGEIPNVPDETKKISPNFTFIVNSVSADQLSNRMRCMAMDHYELASLTVTGIPMKEENHSNASTNYDVELFHPRSLHLNTGILDHCRTKNPAGYETITLKWSSPPRADASIMNFCHAVHRVTFAEVFSRPSTCLTNFILGGRIVMLEIPSKTGDGKDRRSHMLSSFKDEIFIHCLLPNRLSEDTPCATEGKGSRVPDYRYAEFKEIVEASILREWPSETTVPFKMSGGAPELMGNVTTFFKHNVRRLRRFTAYFPITFSATLLPNLRPHIDVLLTAMVKRTISETEALEAKRALYLILQMERKGELYHIIPPYRLKSPRRDNQCKEVWDELTTFIKVHSTSKTHRSIYHEALSLKGKELPVRKAAVPKDKVADQSQRLNRKRDHDSTKVPLTFRPVEVSVLDMWNLWMHAKDRKGRDFAGEMRPGVGVEKLYPALTAAANAAKEESTAPSA